jgi:hypothetical protein
VHPTEGEDEKATAQQTGRDPIERVLVGEKFQDIPPGREILWTPSARDGQPERLPNEFRGGAGLIEAGLSAALLGLLLRDESCELLRVPLDFVQERELLRPLGGRQSGVREHCQLGGRPRFGDRPGGWILGVRLGVERLRVAELRAGELRIIGEARS